MTLDRTKLAKILGLLGSIHDGEVLAAARMAEKLVKASEMTWDQVLAPAQTIVWDTTFGQSWTMGDEIRRRTEEVLRQRQRQQQQKQTEARQKRESTVTLTPEEIVALSYLAMNKDVLAEWEIGFAENCRAMGRNRNPLTRAMHEELIKIYTKVKRYNDFFRDPEDAATADET